MRIPANFNEVPLVNKNISVAPKEINNQKIQFQSLLSDLMNDVKPQSSMNDSSIPNLNFVKESKDIVRNINQLNPNVAIIAQAALSNDEVNNARRRRRVSEIEDKEEKKLTQLTSDKALSITPFQYFSEIALNSLSKISNEEFRVNDLMKKFVDGEVSIEAVSIETTRLNLSIALATTVITTASQTFKEFVSMQI